jgi:hypothetical protein
LQGIEKLFHLVLDKYNNYNTKRKLGEIPQQLTMDYFTIIRQNLVEAQSLIDRIKRKDIPDQANVELKIRGLFKEALTGFSNIDKVPKDLAKDRKEALLNLNTILEQIESKCSYPISDKEITYLKCVYFSTHAQIYNLIKVFKSERFLLNDPLVAEYILKSPSIMGHLKSIFDGDKVLQSISIPEIHQIGELFQDQVAWEKMFEPSTHFDQKEPSTLTGGGGGAAKADAPSTSHAQESQESINARASIIDTLLEQESLERKTRTEKNTLPPKTTSKVKKGADVIAEAASWSASSSNQKKKTTSFEEIVTNAIFHPEVREFAEDKRVKRWNRLNLNATYVLTHPEIFPEYEGQDEKSINIQIALHSGEKLNTILKSENLRNRYAIDCPGGFRINAMLHLRDLGAGAKNLKGVFELGVGVEDQKVYHRYFRRNFWGEGMDHFFAPNLENLVKKIMREESGSTEEDEYQSIAGIEVAVSSNQTIRINTPNHCFITGYTIIPK